MMIVSPIVQVSDLLVVDALSALESHLFDHVANVSFLLSGVGVTRAPDRAELENNVGISSWNRKHKSSIDYDLRNPVSLPVSD